MLPIFVLCETFIIFISMLYLYQGSVWITDGGQATDVYKMMCEKYEEEESFQRMTYCFYVHNKESPFYKLPPKERRDMVCDQYNLFKGKWAKVEKEKVYKTFESFYVNLIKSDNDRNEEVFRAKAEHWRTMLSDIKNTPDEDEAYSKALANATKLAEEYHIKSMMEDGNLDEDGVALYLFEIPEDKKPYHLRLTI